MSRYRILNFITNLDRVVLKRILIKKDAEDPLTLKLQKISLDEHFARLYGPTMLVTQNKVQEMLEEDISDKSGEEEVPVRRKSRFSREGSSDRKITRKFSKFIGKGRNIIQSKTQNIKTSLYKKTVKIVKDDARMLSSSHRKITRKFSKFIRKDRHSIWPKMPNM